MNQLKIASSLPTSLIIDALSQKALAQKDFKQNAISILDGIRDVVSKEVRFINELFSEYTPHDEEYHLSRLFYIGDNLLGQDIIPNLNCSELLILSVSLYAHDWGMAVSGMEKACIAGKCDSKVNPNDFPLLDNERNDFQKFLKESGLTPSVDIGDIPNNVWQEYVRKTHAFRSGDRIRKYFNKINSGLGEAVARVCEGHWRDFKEIQDEVYYPTNYAVANETVNLRALSIYLRLIDLLDITEDRTPYIIWKYVAPKNQRSTMEWEKHRAINSITFPSYQDGRIIQVDGSTQSHEVYAALMDLKSFCEEQLRGCNDILTRINDSRYNLNIFHSNWRIYPQGFKPISMQFEFDRMRMFDILSDEIYQGDKYVFLRELLQNSIDAINVRKQILKNRGIEETSIGLIEIEVKNDSEGNYMISFKDDGVGMDEYIIKNYLSIAGKSYYTSEEFKKIGLELDAISKFGVGILSCFMVADSIEIETFRDPYAQHGKSEFIKLQIPSPSQQFRIQSFVTTDANVGTKINVFLSKYKLQDETSKPFKFDVAGYISAIAGFVPFPIKIDEGGIKTLVLSADEQNISKFETVFPNYDIKQLALHYPWEDAFMPHSIRNAQDSLIETRIDIDRDLNMKGIASGSIVFVSPKDEKVFVIDEGKAWPADEFLIKKDQTETIIKFDRDWIDNDREESEDKHYGKSAISAMRRFKIYLNGILVPNAQEPQNLFNGFIDKWDTSFSYPYLVVNFLKNRHTKIDLSRTEFVEKNQHWEEMLKPYLTKFLLRNLLDDLTSSSSLKERAYKIANSILYFESPVTQIVETLQLENLPVPIVNTKGEVDFIKWENLKNEIIFLQPIGYHHFTMKLSRQMQNEDQPHTPMDNWLSEKFLIVDSGGNDPRPSQINVLIKLSNLIRTETHYFSSFRFLVPPNKAAPPLIQQVWKPKENNEISDVNLDLIAKAVNDIHLFDIVDLRRLALLLANYKSNNIMQLTIPSIGVFDSPFTERFSYGLSVLNLTHQNTKLLLRLICLVIKIENKAISYQLIDLLKKVPYLRYTYYSPVEEHELNNTILKVLEFVQETMGIDYTQYFIKITNDSFVPKSISREKDRYRDLLYFYRYSQRKFNNEQYSNVLK